MSGEVCHFEIPAANVARAKKFYTKAFGWKMNSMPGMGYTLVQTAAVGKNGLPKERGVINGGMMKRQGQYKGPIITLWVQDMDRALQAVRKAGGKVVAPKNPVGDMGFASYFKDSEGNLMGLFQPTRS